MDTQELEVKPDTPVVELEDGGLQVGEKPETESKPEEDQRLNGESDEGEDEQGHAEETPDEAEARRLRNRQRREQNKQNRKAAIESMRRELAARDQIINDLSTRIASVEQQSVGSQMAQLDAAIDEASRYYNHFKEINRIAIEQADGTKAVEAQEKMFVAQQRFNMLSNAKKNMSKPAVQQSAALDPRVTSNTNDWMSRNEWFDASGSDQDSWMAKQIDNRLAQEGWNPATKEYWEELDARIKKYLPHKAVSGYNGVKSGSASGSRPRVPVAGSGSESNSGSKGGYILSAERVKALKEAGVYDDPVARADAIRRFQEFDRQNGQSK